MNIWEWFDVENIEHLKAYKHLNQEGVWPKGFIPEGIERSPGWAFALSAKLADAYVDMKLKETNQ